MAPREKMQFDISFHERDPMGKFHGVEKLVFDMPRGDWTFMHDRLAHAWFRQAGIAAGCAASARVEINGSYYGLFVAEETTNKRVHRRVLPRQPERRSVEGRRAARDEQRCPNHDRLAAFKNATDIAAVTAIVDLDPSLGEWAGEALINDADGYYGGNHNFYIYDQGAKGFVFLPNDTDATFDWLGTFDDVPFDDHPIYWWERRAPPQPTAGPDLAGGDERSGLAREVRRRDRHACSASGTSGSCRVGSTRGRSRSPTRSPPIRTRWATPAQFQMAVAATQRRHREARGVSCRPSSTASKNGAGDDKDGDGTRWCDDCRDDNPAVHPGAPEICGNGVDDDCNGVVDDGC